MSGYLNTTCPHCDEEFLDTFAGCTITAPMITNPPYYRIVCGKCGQAYFYDRKTKECRESRRLTPAQSNG